MRADDWIPIDKAPARIDRSRTTIYRWVRAGEVQTMRIKRKLFVNVPDLVRVERDMVYGRPPTET